MNYEIKALPETVEQCRANLRLTIAALCSDKEALDQANMVGGSGIHLTSQVSP